MKLIIAIVRPFTIDRIVVAFEDIERFPGMTVFDVEGFGPRIRSQRLDVLNPFHRTKQIEIAAPDEMVQQIVEVIREHAHTGKKGDGIILTLPIEEVDLI